MFVIMERLYAHPVFLTEPKLKEKYFSVCNNYNQVLLIAKG